MPRILQLDLFSVFGTALLLLSFTTVAAAQQNAAASNGSNELTINVSNPLLQSDYWKVNSDGELALKRGIESPENIKNVEALISVTLCNADNPASFCSGNVEYAQ